jgi:hypothetical protein
MTKIEFSSSLFKPAGFLFRARGATRFAAFERRLAFAIEY